ncbi:hypothetical protein R6Q59_004268 [Mikania micrantha]
MQEHRFQPPRGLPLPHDSPPQTLPVVDIPSTGAMEVSRGKAVKEHTKQVDPSASSSKVIGQGKKNTGGDGGLLKTNKKAGGFDFSRAVNGDNGKKKQPQVPVKNPKQKEGMSLGNRFTVLEEAKIGSGGSMSSEVCGVAPMGDMGQGE